MKLAPYYKIIIATVVIFLYATVFVSAQTSIVPNLARTVYEIGEVIGDKTEDSEVATQSSTNTPTQLPGSALSSDQSLTPTEPSSVTTQSQETQTTQNQGTLQEDPKGKYCEETTSTLNTEELNAYLSDGTLPEGKTEKNYFREQWCAFQNGEQAQWNNIQGKEKFMQKLSGLYGESIDLTQAIPESWDTDNNVQIGNTNINLDLDTYYGDDNTKQPFTFQGAEYKYDRRTISKITKDDKGNTVLTFQGEKEVTSTITLQGEDAKFNPNTMQVTSKDNTYTWNGQGDLTFSTDGTVNLKYKDGTDKTDTTNFPVLSLPNGEQLSPYQNRVTDAQIPEGITKPKSGVTTYKDKEGTTHILDSKGNIYKVQDATFKLNNKGQVSEITDSYLNLGDDNGEACAVGTFKTTESKDSSYLTLQDDNLNIKSNKGDTLYYNQQKDLKKVNLQGEGTSYVRNGNTIFKSENEEISQKNLPKELQKKDASSYGVEALTTPKTKDNPYKVEKDAGGQVKTTDNSGREADIKKIKPEETTPTTTQTTTTPTNPTGDKIRIDLNPLTAGPVAYSDAGYYISGNGNFEKGLSKDQFIDKLLREGNFRSVLTMPTGATASIAKEKMGKYSPTPQINSLIDNLPSSYGFIGGSKIDMQVQSGQITMNGVNIGRNEDTLNFIKRTLAGTANDPNSHKDQQLYNQYLSKAK